MLHLHHADQLDPLLDGLADVLSVVPADPFAGDLVVVPAAGMHDAALVGLGKRLGASAPGAADGVVANVEFVFPGRFLARALGDHGSDDVLASDPWRLPRLTWAVLDVLASGAVEVPGRTGVDQWALARRIADLFDRYASQRPRLLSAWADGVDTDGVYLPDGVPMLLDPAHVWQAQLWRAVRASLAFPSPPERLPHLLHALRSGEVQPQLPSRVSLFGLGAIAPTMLTVLRALGQVSDVHVFLRHPSLIAWQSSANQLDGSFNQRALVDVTTHTRHPLLGSWGRPSLETCALLGGVDELEDHPLGIAAVGTPTTVLGALQQGIRLDLAPAPVPGINAADGSFQVHACHGDVRQLEALRDALGHAFVADPTLAPHEVLVLCPDLERFAPLADAVFQRGSLPIPVRIGDRSLTTDEPIVAALHAVLELVAGRATLSEVLAMVQFEPVRRRFGWSVDHIEQLASWCASLGTRWGLSPHHRTGWGLPADMATGTWQATIDSLLAGVALSAPTPRVVVGDVAPYDDLGADDLELVGSVAELLARLGALHAQVQHRRPIADWVELLQGVVGDFTDVDVDDAWRCQAVLRDLDDIAESARTGDLGRSSQVPLALSDVRAVLADALHDRPGRLALRSGAVTISSFVPQHGVPARVVCLLGVDEGSLRGGTFDGDDILGLHPCVGERHPRFEARQVLLDAVLAARERLLITCNGADITTNSDVPFVVPLVELLDVVGALVPLHHGRPILIRHPRHGFNEVALVPGALWKQSPVPFTFDPAMLHAAQARRTVAQLVSGSSGSSPWALPPMPLHEIELDALVDVVARPARVYLQRRLDVRLPFDAEVIDDGLSVDLDGRSSSRLGADLLAARRGGSSVDQWEVAARLDGNLPPRALSDAVFGSISAEVGRLEVGAAAWSVPLVGTDELRVDLPLGVTLHGSDRAVVVRGTLGGVAPSPDGPVLVQVRFTRHKPSHRLSLAVQLAVAQCIQPDLDWSAVLITRSKSSSSDKPVSMRLRVRGAGEARAANALSLLEVAVQLLDWAQRDAVPLFDEASSALAAEQISAAIYGLDNDLARAEVALLWPDVSIESLQRDPALVGDPAGVRERTDPDAGGHAVGRGIATARWVWDAYDSAIEESGDPSASSDADEADRP
jgi:exodeoxyribonuclease V gamma subunit